MIKSMTGFGRGREVLNGRDITVEIRSVNHRYYEFSARIPRSLSFAEDKLRALLAGKIGRGKVEVSVYITNTTANDEQITVNKQVLSDYVTALRSVQDEFSLMDDLALSHVLRMPDALTVVKEQTDEEQLWADVSAVAQQALERFITMREAEGVKMRDDFLARLKTIEEWVGVIEERSPRLVEEYRTRLFERMKEVLEGRQVDEGRILLEAAIYSEKTAVDEETVRLRSHIAQFRTMLESGEPVGRKLDFLVQEMNRETNTIGSKVQDLEVTHIVVDQKSEIEKIREQVQNIE